MTEIHTYDFENITDMRCEEFTNLFNFIVKENYLYD